MNRGTSLAVQWFRFHAPNAGDMGSIPGWGTKIQYATQHGQKKDKLEYIHTTEYYPPLFKDEQAMAPHSRTLALKIPWTEEPGRLQPMGLRRVGHN